MESSRLVHRLSAPRGGKGNPYTFGVGLPSGGFNEEGLDRIRGVFEFGSMGAGEYEFGAPQRAMEALWEDRKQLVSFDLQVGVSGYTEKRPVFVVCRAADQEEVSSRVRAWARWGGHSKQYPTRDSVLLPHVLREAHEGSLEDYSTRGWLELNNGFFFTVDEQMAEGFRRLMDLDVAKDALEVGV
jgi:hypothetical protein